MNDIKIPILDLRYIDRNEIKEIVRYSLNHVIEDSSNEVFIENMANELTDNLMDNSPKKEVNHVDDFIDNVYRFDKKDKETRYARFFLFLHRLCAVLKADWSEFYDDKKLFCDYKGKKYRVTGASRLGDIWLRKDFNCNYGYDKRVNVKDCSNWSAN